jgi:hypothetical protein
MDEARAKGSNLWFAQPRRERLAESQSDHRDVGREYSFNGHRSAESTESK